MATPEGSPTLAAVRDLYISIAKFDRAAAALLNLHITDLHCLDLIQRMPRSGKSLASELGLTPSAVTTLLDRLEAHQYVARRASKADRRQIEVHLTATGRRRAARAYRELGHRIAEVEQGQTPAKNRAIAEALQSLSQACTDAARAVSGIR